MYTMPLNLADAARSPPTVRNRPAFSTSVGADSSQSAYVSVWSSCSCVPTLFSIASRKSGDATSRSTRSFASIDPISTPR